jgi:predicted acetyltransferase
MAGLDVQEDGAFAFPPSLAAYWDRAGGGHPFLIRADEKPVGFALVRQLAADTITHDMGEFFVLRKYRRLGVGRDVACRLFDRFAGNWEVRELPANTPAQAFWRRIIADYTAGDFDDRREYFEAYRREFVVQRFRSGGPSSRSCM